MSILLTPDRDTVMPVHKLRALEYLVAVVDHGGFAAAARRLGVAAPSVHRAVKALEAELGQPLLDRTASTPRPTGDAAEYVARARGLIAEMHSLDAGLRDRAQAPSGTITIAAHGVVSQFVLADLLPAFHARHPGIHIDLVEPGAERDLAKLGTDMLLMFGWPPAQDANLRTLAHTRWVVVATPAYWARHGLPAHPSDLRRHDCVQFRTPYGEVIRRWVFERGDERVDVEIDGWLTGDQRSVLDAPVLAGQMVARLNDLTADRALATGALQPVLLDWTGVSSPPLNLLIRRAVQRQPRIRTWVEFLVEAMAARTRHRLPAGLPPVQPARRPDWFARRVGRH